MSRFENIAGKLLRWPSLAALTLVSVVSAVGLGGESKAGQKKDAEQSLFALPLVPPETPPQYAQRPEPPVEFRMRMRQITDRLHIGAKDPKSCSAEAAKEANIQLKSGMWNPALGDLFLICTSKDKKTDLLRQKNTICEPSKGGPVCSDPDELII